MDKAKLSKAVIETLGFNPEEFRYKLEENTLELSEIKNHLSKIMPMIGHNILEFQLVKEFLKTHKLDPTEFIEKELSRLPGQLADQQEAQTEIDISKPAPENIIQHRRTRKETVDTKDKRKH
jgi:hypothetical protein